VIQGLVRTYGDAAEQGPHAPPVALVGSAGLLEIAVPGGHAALRLGLAPGDPVTLHY
jgi:S-adenosylmethionine hydrolase